MNGLLSMCLICVFRTRELNVGSSYRRPTAEDPNGEARPSNLLETPGARDGWQCSCASETDSHIRMSWTYVYISRQEKNRREFGYLLYGRGR